MAANQVRVRLEAARKNLLDITLRNKLIHYKIPKARGVSIVDEDPVEIFQMLVTEGKKMMFVGLPDSEGDDEDAQEPLPVDTTDEKLNTAETEKSLRNRLLKTWRDAQSSIEEQGINILFLALGALEWYESDSSDIPLKAPLILIPVLLERGRGNRFTIEYEGTEVGENLSLASKLEQDFRIELPDLPESDDIDVKQYFEKVAKAISSQKRWRVDDKGAALGFFSYSKYLIYKDLEGSLWPDVRKPWDHPIVNAILSDGFDDVETGISNTEDLDILRPVGEVHEVCDADSSQILALLEAHTGRSMIIEGPPGTGKSQTITNLIAESVGAGEKVLFVAEKRAALEIVQRNLERAGLGKMCLELHSHKTNKKAFYEALRSTMELGQPRTDATKVEIKRLSEARERLREYCRALHEPLAARGLSPFQAMGHLVLLGPEANDIRKPSFSIMAGWTDETFRVKLDLVGRIERKIKAIGVPSQNIFFDSQLDLILPEDEQKILLAAKKAYQALRAYTESLQAVSRAMVIEMPSNTADVLALIKAAHAAIEAPPLTGVKVNTHSWQNHADFIQNIITSGIRYADIHRQYDGELQTTAWLQDVSTEREILHRWGTRWYRIFIKDYWRIRSRLGALCAGCMPSSVKERMGLIDAIIESQEISLEIRAATPICGHIFGNNWKEISSDWAFLNGVSAFILNVRKQVSAGEIPSQVLAFLEGAYERDSLSHKVVYAETTETAAEGEIRAFLDSIHSGPSIREMGKWPFTDQLARLDACSADLNALKDLVSFNQLKHEAEQQGLGEAAKIACEWGDASARLAEGFKRTWYSGIVREAFSEREVLAKFDRTEHEGTVNTFKELDETSLRYNRAKVALAHWQGVPRHNLPGGVGLLQREFAKSRRHMPIRQIMSRAGDAIQAIKPVFMMSPISTAMYLPPDGPVFDLLIFDEASQIKPEDAFCPIIRSKQIIVVGDSKQMPPTSFFDRLTQGEDDDEEVEDINVTRDMESILALMSSRLPPSSPARRSLKWHYRSRHDALIVPSNALFYGHKLVVFPTPERRSPDMGLFFHYCPSTVYDRGGSRKNVEEARIVVKAIFEHVEKYPERSLGVAAFSVAQQEAIYDELELVRKNSSALAAFEARHTLEPLFIKNLETVQGDERDVIIISIGYGRDADGFISMSFGPLNKEGGERRLNVLITRARVRCDIFSNLRSDDLRLSESPGAGVSALKTFLHYAESGKLDIPVPPGEPMSPFEEAVIACIRQRGFTAVPQVGSAGFYIDIGVCDPDNRDRYILGIECDGAKYHSARCTRDRDRLRQVVLEKRGWRIHRIWGTDWYRNQLKEERRLLSAIEQAVEANSSVKELDELRATESSVKEVAEDSAGDVPRHASREKANSVPTKKYTFSKIKLSRLYGELWDVTPSKMAELIDEIVWVESPVHIDEVIRRLREAAGLERAGNRIRSAIQKGVNYAKKQGAIIVQGDFLWKAPLHTPEVRNRCEFPNAVKKLEYIHTEEIKIAILMVVKHAYGVSREDAVVAASSLMGFERTTESMRINIERCLSELVDNGIVRADEDILRINNDA